MPRLPSESAVKSRACNRESGPMRMLRSESAEELDSGGDLLAGKRFAGIVRQTRPNSLMSVRVSEALN